MASTSMAGAPISHDGVSILEMTDGQIVRFRASFDPNDLGRTIAGAMQGS